MYLTDEARREAIHGIARKAYMKKHGITDETLKLREQKKQEDIKIKLIKQWIKTELNANNAHALFDLINKIKDKEEPNN